MIYRYMPIRDLRRVMDLPKKTDELVATIKKFWGIDALDFGFLDDQAACFRKSDAHKSFNPYYALTWLQLVKNALVGKRAAAKYCWPRLEDLARRLPEYTELDNGVCRFIEEMSQCGVIFLQVDPFDQTYIDGASFFSEGRPVIVYTARHDRIDNFWFTMAHELGHVIHHENQRGQFSIDSLDHLDLTQGGPSSLSAVALTKENLLVPGQAVACPSHVFSARCRVEMFLNKGMSQAAGRSRWSASAGPVDSTRV